MRRLCLDKICSPGFVSHGLLGLWRNGTYRVLTNGSTAANQLATSAKPLTFGYKGYTVAFLVNGQVATVTEYDCIGIFTVAVVAYGTLGVLLFTLASRLAVHCCSTTGAWTVGLRRFWIRLGNTCMHVSFTQNTCCRQLLAFFQCMPLLFNLGDCDLENGWLNALQVFLFPVGIKRFQPPVILLIHVVLDAAQRNGAC